MTAINRATGWFGPVRAVAPVGLPASALNTTATPLGADDTYTGEWEQVDCPDVGVSCKSDVDGTLFFDFSNDAVNADPFPPAGFATTGGIHEFHTAVKLPRYFRVRYVNGSTAQSYLRLYTYYGQYRQGNAPLNLAVANDADAIIVRSVDTELDLALGRFGGMTEDTKFGYVEAVDAADSARDVWALATETLSVASDTKTFPTAASTIYAASDDTGDNDVTITVPYLDATGALQTEDIALAGRARVRVSDTGDGLDCNRAYETGAVAATGNVYIIYGTDTGSGEPNDITTALAYIPAGKGQTQQALDTVPLGYTMRMKFGTITIARASGALGSATISLRTRLDGGTWITKRYWNLPNGVVTRPLVGLVFPALTNIEMRVEDVSDADTQVTAEWHYDLVAV